MEGEIQQLLHRFPAPLLMVDGALQVLACSRRAAALFEIRRGRGEELAGQLSAAIAADRQLGDELALATARLAGPEAEEAFSWRRGERSYEVRAWAAPFGADRFLVLFADLTHQRISEEIQLDARHYLERILASVSLGVVVLNGELKVTFVNQRQLFFLEKLGVRLGLVEAIGATLEALLPAGPGAQWQELCLPVVRGAREGARLRQRFALAGGEELVLAAEATPLRNHRGQVAGAILVCEDLTLQSRLEQELLRMEKLAVVGQMVVAVNHEINNPLGIIANSAQSLRLLHPEFDEKVVAKLRTIETQVKRIAAVTQRLRTMTELRAEDYIADGPKMLDLWRGEQAK
jgi:PAS domain-containing protein